MPLQRITTALTLVLIGMPADWAPAQTRLLRLETQTRDPKTSQVLPQTIEVESSKVAVVIVDPWNFHWCMTACERVSAMVPRWNRALECVQIRYTLDGSNPRHDSALCDKPIVLETTARLRAAAYRGEKRVSLPVDAFFARLPVRPPAPDIYLDDLSYQVDPYAQIGSVHAGFFWLPKAGQSYEGQPLRVRGRVYARGLGCRAPSGVRYALKPEYDHFVALAGIDDTMIGRDLGQKLAIHSSIVFRVFVDGVQAAESPVMRVSQEPWRFDVPIPPGSRYLHLACMDAGTRHLADLGNWVEAGFVLKEGKAKTRIRAARENGAWRAIPVPGYWERAPGGQWANYDGTAWYRCYVEIPASWDGRDAELHAERVDNRHETFPVAAGSLIFACSADNDLYRVVAAGIGQTPARFDAPSVAVARALPGAVVLMLADDYPQRTTVIETAVFEAAAAKNLRLYVEYPASLPDFVVHAPKPAGIRRGVITSELFGAELPPLRIVALSGCQFVPVRATNALMVLAKVAGVDTAAFGLKDTPTDPILFEHPRGRVLVATTKLSHFVTGRSLPTDAWRTIWEGIFRWLQPESQPPALRWTPTVRPSFSREAPLPADTESQALRRSADWIFRSRLLRHPAWPDEALKRSLTYNTVRDRPRAEWPAGDGSLGLLEGFSSTIRADGSQPVRYAVRNDCVLESAMLLAFDALNPGRQASAQTASNLVDYIFRNSGLAGGPRADPNDAAYGLVGWALDSPGAYWGDDNARALLALAALSASMNDSRWDEALARCLLANFRTTGRAGFREACIMAQTLRTNGWQAYWNASPVQYSPHFQSWLWCCFFWAYEQTRFEPLRERSLKGLRQMMAAYPQRWDWVNRSGAIERARVLLPLAWLVRIDDTPEHRRWLRRVAEDLIALQDASGALRETIGDGGPGTASNAEYGTRETSLIQTNGDPVCDLLYTCNFALIGLHEAAAATGDPLYRQAEDRLARFLCRIQIRSEAHPEMDGAWYRAFDFRRWEYWASNADWEWGPWCIESGWTQPWIASTFALRQRHTSLWEWIRGSRMHEQFTRLRPQMLPDEALLPKLGGTAHAARGKPVEFATEFAPPYPGGGVEGLTDGELATTDYHHASWQGYWGSDLLATVDLGTVQPVHRVCVRFLQQVSVGIFLPTTVEVALSPDGRNFDPPVTLKPDVPEREARPLIKTLTAELGQRSARFVRVRARNLGTIPDWHTARRQKAWLFVDEILVNPTAPAGGASSPAPRTPDLGTGTNP